MSGAQAERVEIRRAGPDDAAVVARIHAAASRAAYGPLLPRAVVEDFANEREGPARWRERLARGGGSLALVDGEPCGFVTHRRADEDEHEIGALYVAPEWWRRGVGRALLRHALGELAAEGAREITLWVLEGNGGAERFYEAMGFRLDGAEQRRPIAGGAKERRYRLKL